MDTIIQIITGVGFILFAGFAEGLELKERYLATTYIEKQKLNRAWHWLQFFERVFAILFGFTVGAFSGYGYDAVRMIFAASVLFWIIYDLIINYYLERDLFKPSKTSTSWFEKIYWLKPVLLIIAIVLFVVGCSGTRVIETIRVDTIRTASPTIEEILDAKTITDTIITSNKIVDKDTVIDVRYYPVEKKFYIKAKPDTVTIIKMDTLTTFKVEQPANTKGYYLIGLIALAIVTLLIIITLKK